MATHAFFVWDWGDVSDGLAEEIGFVEILGILHGTFAAHADGFHASAFGGMGKAYHETAECVDGSLGSGFIGVGARCDVVKFFPFEALVAVAAVHQGFQLSVDVHVIDRARQHYYVGIRHFLDEHRSLVAIGQHCVGGDRVLFVKKIYSVIVKEDFLYVAASLGGSFDKFIAQEVGVASAARTGRQYKHFLVGLIDGGCVGEGDVVDGEAVWVGRGSLPLIG